MRIISFITLLSCPLAVFSQAEPDQQKAARSIQQRWMVPVTKYDLSDALAFSGDGKYLAAGSNDGIVRVFNTKDGTIKKEWKAHAATINFLVFHPSAPKVISSEFSGKPNSLIFWNAETGKEEWTLLPNTVHTSTICFSRDGSLFATVGLDKATLEALKIWESESREIKLMSKQPNIVRGVAISPNRKVAAFCVFARQKGRPATGNVVLWDIEKNASLRTIENAFKVTAAMQCWFSPDGKNVITANSEMVTSVWEAETGKLAHPLKGCCRAYASEANIIALSRTEEDKLFYKGLSLVDARTDTEIATLKEDFLWAALSPDGRYLAGVISGEGPNTLRVWELTPKAEKKAR